MSKPYQEIQGANQNPYEIFQKEHPEVAARFNDLIEARRALKGLDVKAKQLINISHSVCESKPERRTDACDDGKTEGATREEIIGEVILNLHHSGFAKILECLPAAI